MTSTAYLTGEPTADNPYWRIHYRCHDCEEMIFLRMNDDVVKARHGQGEAARDFTSDEYLSPQFQHWLEAVHEYERAR